MTETGWQRIETAPCEEYEYVLLYNDERDDIRVGFWENGKWATDYPNLDDPTHWMAIPQPPRINVIRVNAPEIVVFEPFSNPPVFKRGR